MLSHQLSQKLKLLENGPNNLYQAIQQCRMGPYKISLDYAITVFLLMKYEFVANPIFVEVILLFYYIMFTLTILNIDQKKDSNEFLSRSTFLYGLASRWYSICI